MAANYEQFKQAWNQMGNAERRQYTEQYKNDSTFQQFAQQYSNEMKGTSTNSNQNNGGVNNNNNNGGVVNNTTGTNNNSNSNNQNDTNGGFSNNNSNNSNSGGSTLSDGRNGDGNFYGKTSFDEEEKLDKSMFNNPANEGIVVKEGSAKETGRPDYQIETDARLNEMRDNLDRYYRDSPRMFGDRETFNKQFEYNERQSEAQRQLLDSYWKKAQDDKAANTYTNSDQLKLGFSNGDVTPGILDAIKYNNPELYAQWEKAMQDDLNARIANYAVPRTATQTADIWMDLVKRLGIEAGDPYQIYDNWVGRCEQLGVFNMNNQLSQYISEMEQVKGERTAAMQRTMSQGAGRKSQALIDAEVSKTSSLYDARFADLQNMYQATYNQRQQNLAIANQSAQMLQAQAAEDQRIFNNKITGLGFAMKVDDYRTPEQQLQNQLRFNAINNDLQLLNKAKSNDLELYNKYATAKLENQLEYELQDLNVKDPAQLKANLSRVLDSYYKEYGDIIQRPKQQVIDDVLKLAKESGMSVAEALKANFIQPLQNKDEYVQSVADKYGMNPTQSIQNIGDKVALVTKYPNGKMSYQILDDVYNPKYDLKTINGKSYLVVDDGNGVPQLKYIGGDGTVLNYASLNQGLQSFMSKYEDGTFYKEKGCGYFCNEYLTSIGDAGHVGSTWESKKALCSNKDWKNMVVGSIVAIDSGATYTNDKGEKVNAGHVSIVAGYDPATGKVLLYDANRDGKGHVSYHETTVDKLYGYYTPEAYKNAGTELPEYLSNENEYGFVDSMVGTYGKYIAGDLTVQKRIDALGGDDVIVKQVNNWLNYLNAKGKNKDGYIEGAEDLYENYLESGKLPSSTYLSPLGGFNEFKDQAKAYGEAVGYGRYAKVNDKGYYDDLTNLYDEYIKSNKVPTEAQVEAYGGLDDFYKTAKAYSQSVGYRFTPEEQTKEISEMRDKWLTSQEYKDMMGRVDAFDSINAMLTTGKGAYGDYTAIYLLNKLRDPDSVVREGEFANTQNVGGIDDRIFNYFKKLQNGERLNDNQRIEIQNTLGALMKAKTNTYNNSLSQYRSSALKGGDTSKIGALISISNLGKISFGNLTGDIIEPPHSDELN